MEGMDTCNKSFIRTISSNEDAWMGEPVRVWLGFNPRTAKVNKVH